MLPQTGAAAAVAALSSMCACVLLVSTKQWHGHLTLDSTLGVQKFHTAPTPRVGGLAILAGAITAYGSAPHSTASLLVLLLVAAGPAFGAGLLEDLTKKVSVVDRLAATLSSGLLGWALTGAALHHTGIGLLDMALSFTPVAVLFTAFCVGGMSNAVNIIDGFNGLAGGVVVIMLTSLGIMAAQFGDADVAYVCLLIAASVVGFLALNWPAGKLFLGDGGAYLLGFLVGWIAVMLLARHPQLSPWGPLLACAYPVLEVAFSFYRKSRRAGSSPGQPDRLHLHMLVHRRLVKLRLYVRSTCLQNAITSPFAWAYAASTAAWAAVFAQNTALLVAGFCVAAIAYWRFYVRLAKFRWWPLAAQSVRKPLSLLPPAAGLQVSRTRMNMRPALPPPPLPRAPLPHDNARPLGTARLVYGALGISSCFALVEPAPFDVLALLLVAAHVATSARSQSWRVAGPLAGTTLALLALFAILQFVPVALQAESPGHSAFYAAVTTMLIVIAIHLGVLHGRGDVRFSTFLAGYAAAALFSAAIAILSLHPRVAAMMPAGIVWEGRPKAFFKDPNVFAPYLIPAVLLYLEAAGRRRGVRTGLFVACAVICAGGVVVSASRAAWINLAIVLVLYGAFSCRRQRAMLISAGLLASIAAVLVTGIPAGDGVRGALALYSSRLHLQEYDNDRFAVAREAVEIGLRFPAGVGPGEVATYLAPGPGMDPHNTYVRIWAENGPVALALFSVILLLLAAHAIEECVGNRKLKPSFVCAFALLAGALVNAGVVDTLHWRHFWVILVVCLFSFNGRSARAFAVRGRLVRV
jgi:UDP-N-acetylmuramyl pentapeptide phosphotransferase/UDP-N-acetylglucosamine-1-phosphate transferase/O-antigen ligase